VIDLEHFLDGRLRFTALEHGVLCNLIEDELDNQITDAAGRGRIQDSSPLPHGSLVD
jgi:hypothetical protein